MQQLVWGHNLSSIPYAKCLQEMKDEPEFLNIRFFQLYRVLDSKAASVTYPEKYLSGSL